MPPLTPEQLALRQTFIGGSDAAAICGVNPYRTAYEVFLDKTGQGKPIIETEAMYWGTIHEDAIATRYGVLTGRDVYSVGGSRVCPYAQFVGCHIDREQHLRASGEIGVLECKSTRRNLKVGQCPDEYVVQLYHNLICCQLTWGTVAILIQGSQLVWYDYRLTPEIERRILTIESRFWKAVQAKDWLLFGVE